MINTADIYPPLSVDQTFENKSDTIALLNPTVGRKMLGAVSAPNGNTKDQYEELLSKAKTWGAKIKTSYLHRFDANMSLRQGIIKSLEYPLGVSLMTEQQCNTIMVPILTPYLHKMGMNSKISRDIIYGPNQYGGLQVPNLYTSNGIQKIQLFLGHFRKRDTTGTILDIALGTLQQEIGISIPILQADYTQYGYLASPSWCNCLWRFLHEIRGKIRLTQPWVPEKCYENDVNIMEKASTWDWPKDKLEALNISRLYMRVYYVGELLDTSKTRLRHHIKLFLPSSFHSNKFPTIPQLPKYFKDIWLDAIRRLIRESNIGSSMGDIISTVSFKWFLSQDMMYLIETDTSPKSHQRTTQKILKNIPSLRKPT